MNETANIPVSRVEWKGAVRIIRSAFPPIDLFEDIADPADWPLLISAEQKTNPRIMATIGNLDLVQVDRRVGGNGASYLMAPFTHVSTDRLRRAYRDQQIPARSARFRRAAPRPGDRRPGILIEEPGSHGDRHR